MRAGRSPLQTSRQHGVDFDKGVIEQIAGATGSRPFGNSGITTAHGSSSIKLAAAARGGAEI
jgi:hypothetical protein